MVHLSDPARIIIFAKTPLPGLVKTRLTPVLGSSGAAKLAERMLTYTVQEGLKAINNEPNLSLELCIAPDIQHPFWQKFSYSERFTLSEQGNGDLGDRLLRAASKAIDNGERAILIGTDCPGIDSTLLKNVVRGMDLHDAVICPTDDGGYALLGLRRFDHSLFSGIPWSTDKVAGLTFEKLEKLDFSVNRLVQLYDIDVPGDLSRLPEHWLTGIQKLA